MNSCWKIPSRRLVKSSVVIASLLLCSFAIGDEASQKRVTEKFLKEQAELQAAGKPLRSVNDLFGLLDEEDRRRIVRQMALSGGFFSDLPGRWPLIDEAAVALPWLNIEKEPLNESVLTALERCAAKTQNEDELLKLNAILYRYSRPAGKDFLLRLLPAKQNIEAAKILALNQEPEALDPIVRMLRSGTFDTELLFALGRWGKQTDSVLFWALDSGTFDSLSITRALAMGDHHLSGSTLEKIKSYYKPASGSMSVEIAGLLLRNSSESEQYLAYLIEALKGNSGDAAFAAWSLNQASRSEAKPVLRTLLSEYLASGDEHRFEELHSEALIGLVRDASDEDWRLALKILASFSVGPSPTMDRERVSVASILYRKAPQAIRKQVSEMVGEEFNLGLPETSNLKRLPPRYLPFRSRMVEWRRFILESGDQP